MGLVLCRRSRERVLIQVNGVEVWVTYLGQGKGRQGKLSFQAPPEVVIVREEAIDRRLDETKQDR